MAFPISLLELHQDVVDAHSRLRSLSQHLRSSLVKILLYRRSAQIRNFGLVLVDSCLTLMLLHVGVSAREILETALTFVAFKLSAPFSLSWVWRRKRSYSM